MKNTSLKEAGYRAQLATRLWRKVSRCESELRLLMRLRRLNMGTARLENFIDDLKGEQREKLKGNGDNIENKKNTKNNKKNNIKRKPKNKYETHLVRRMMNKKVKDARKTLENVMKRQDKMKERIKDEIEDKKTVKKIIRKLEKSGMNEEKKCKKKEEKKIEFMIKKYGSQKEDSEETRKIKEEFKGVKNLNPEHHLNEKEDKDKYEIMIIELDDQKG